MESMKPGDGESVPLVNLAQQLEQVLKLRVPPIGMRLFESTDALTAIPRLRRPQAVLTTDQVVAQAARLGWTVGITGDDLVGPQCRAVIGLGGQDQEHGAQPPPAAPAPPGRAGTMVGTPSWLISRSLLIHSWQTSR